VIHHPDEYLAGHPFFSGLGQEALTLIAGCAQNVHLEAGRYLFHEGDAADMFYVVRRGRVALEVHSPGTGSLVVDTMEDTDVVGWSWLVSPYRWFFDARAVEPTSLVALDGACLRGKCEEDPSLGYALMQRIAGVMYQRLQAARLRLLDVYGEPSAPHH
jgi:CRP/FNR family transcriptional regulator, cyclic AMP receptor protein